MTTSRKPPTSSHVPTYDPVNWYWSTPTVPGFVFSSWRSMWVPASDIIYHEWQSLGGIVSVQSSTAAIAAILLVAGLHDASIAAGSR